MYKYNVYTSNLYQCQFGFRIYKYNHSIFINNQDLYGHQYEFDWSRPLQGFVISSNSIGCFLGFVFGSNLPTMYGTKRVGLVTMALTGIFTAMSPTGARIHVGVYMTLNALAGATASIQKVATLVVISAWAPVQERALLCNMRVMGVTVSITLPYLYVGFLMSTGKHFTAFFNK